MISDQLGKTFSSQVDVAFRRGPRFFLEHVQDIHRIHQTGGINHPISTCFVLKSDFLNALANRRHRFEIIRLRATLHLIELVSCVMAGILREVAEALQRITEKTHGFHSAPIILMWIYTTIYGLVECLAPFTLARVATLKETLAETAEGEVCAVALK
jgi:hypothetical protein